MRLAFKKKKKFSRNELTRPVMGTIFLVVSRAPIRSPRYYGDPNGDRNLDLLYSAIILRMLQGLR